MISEHAAVIQNLDTHLLLLLSACGATLATWNTDHVCFVLLAVKGFEVIKLRFGLESKQMGVQSF
jgi:hypothetical protein